MDKPKKERLDECITEGKTMDFSSSDQDRTFTKIDREEEWPEPPKEEKE